MPSLLVTPGAPGRLTADALPTHSSSCHLCSLSHSSARRTMLWIPPIRLVPIGLRPSAGDISAFAVAASREAEVCQYPGSVDDVPPLWLINHSKRAIGRGQDAYTRASSALEAFECLELSWLTHSLHADALAICSRQFYFLWLMNANRLLPKAGTAQSDSPSAQPPQRSRPSLKSCTFFFFCASPALDLSV